MDLGSFIGVASFICGVLLMFAIHRVVFDHYANAAESYIEDLKKEIRELKGTGMQIEVEHKHTFAASEDVNDIRFGD